MNKCKLNSLVIALLLLVPCLAFALPGAHDPASGGYAIVCNSCHIQPKTFGNTNANYTDNVCLTCHLSGTNNTKKVFRPEDFADLAGTSTVPRGTPVQSSHKWFGSEVVPQAAALAPVDTSANGLNKTAFKGSLSCARCHNIHGSSGLQSNTAPYLRVANDSDQMCTNCHRSRDKSDHTFGTHPVNVSYSTAYKAQPTLFRAQPDSGNANSQLKIVSGKVVCSSCHKVHAADSRTATLDNYSSGHAFTNLSASKGYLLRVDQRGKAANDINICTNCHTNKFAHNKAGQNVQCNDCHGAHVEYDTAANAGDTSNVSNVSLVRRYLSYSAAGRISKRIIYNDSVNKKYYIAGGGGVCQSCHAVPQATHFSGATLIRTNCAGCHTHSEATGSFSVGAGGCDTCHGYPVTSNANKEPGYTGNEDTSPHVTHVGGGSNYSLGCNQCHNGSVGAGATHNESPTKSYASVFVDKVAVGTNGVLAGSAATYSGGTCSAVYCHSNGSSTSATGSATWAGQLNTLNCGSCHASTPTTGSHTRHATTFAYGCARCHSTTVSNNTTISNLANHVNAVKDVSFSGTLPTTTGSNCSAVYCHSNGKGVYSSPTWGGAAACGSCHATATVPGGFTTTSHATHFAQLGDTTNSSCTTCHVGYTETGANHVNGTINVNSPTACASCHADPYSTGAVTPPTWGTSATGCSACHSAFPITATGPATGSHTTIAGHAVACTTCHAAGTTATVAPSTGHTDGNIDVANVGYATLNKTKGTAGVTCNNASCHVSPVSTALIVTPAWGSTGNGCAACHAGANAITATGPATGSHTTIAGHAVACTTCHAAGTTATVVPSTGHADGNIDVANVGYLTLNKTKGTAGVTCNNASCHVSPVSTALIVTPAWGSTGNGCAACHAGANAITATGPATGSHTTIAGHAVACTTCHAAGTTATVAPSTGHADGNIDVANVGYLTLNKTKGTAGVTCNNASCHVSPVSTALIVTPAWGSTGNGCAACHAGANAITATGPATGSHTTIAGHAVACTTCHAAGTTATVAPSTGHADGNIDVANVGYLTLNKTKGTAGVTCSTTACHGSTSPAWGANTSNVACTKCHGKPTLTNYSTTNAWQAAPGYAQAAGSGTYTNNVSDTAPYGAHDAHVRAINQYTTRKTLCSDCHGALPVSNSHANGLTMSFSNLAKNIGTSGGSVTTGPSTRGTLTPTYSAGTCSAVYCHGGVMAGTDTTPEWRFTGTSYLTTYAKNVTNCGKCHAALPNVTAKDHSTMTFATQNCNGCHGHEGNGANHIDGILQASGACDSCHGYQVGSWAGATAINAEGKGAHEAHITWLTTKRFTQTLNPATDSYAAATTAWTNVCGICHGNTAGNHNTGTVNVTLSTAYAFGSSPTYKGTPGVSSASVGSEKTCSNISCHYFTTPLWSTY